MTVSKSDKVNYYKSIFMEQIIGGNGVHKDDNPETLKEAVALIVKATPDSITKKIKEGSYDPGYAHHGFGMWMRNNWGLWSGSKLQDWFHEKGIRHADDMSGIILETVKRDICGDDWDVPGQVKHYREYWKDQGVDPDMIGKNIDPSSNE